MEGNERAEHVAAREQDGAEVSMRAFHRRAILTGAVALGVSAFVKRARAENDLDNYKFAQEVLDLLHKLRPDYTFELGSKPATLVKGGQELYLGNLYDLVNGRSGQDRENRILDFVDAVVTSVNAPSRTQAFDEVRGLLRARIVPEIYETQTLGGDVRMVVRPLSKTTRIAYAIDGEKTVQFVTTQNLSNWTVTADSVHDLAIANLDGLAHDTEIAVKTLNGGAGHYATVNIADSYAAARLLSPVFMRRLREGLGGNIFAGVPNRDFLVAWSADFARKQEFAAQVAKDAATEAYALTDEIFVSSDQGLRLATPKELADHGRGG